MRVLAIVVAVALGGAVAASVGDAGPASAAPASAADAGAASAAPASAATPKAAAIERARQRALTPSYQAELPGRTGSGSASPDPAAKPHKPGEKVPRLRDTREARALEPGSLSPLLRLLLWGVVVVVGVLLVAWFAFELAKREDAAVLQGDDERPRSEAETEAIIERPLGDADELARRGAYAEAIHTLLLRTLQELARGAAVRVERSHTSREILARVPLLADAREALAGLITAVELTHFGDDPAGAGDYDRCREQFHRFAAALRGRAAAA